MVMYSATPGLFTVTQNPSVSAPGAQLTIKVHIGFALEGVETTGLNIYIKTYQRDGTLDAAESPLARLNVLKESRADRYPYTSAGPEPRRYTRHTSLSTRRTLIN